MQFKTLNFFLGGLATYEPRLGGLGEGGWAQSTPPRPPATFGCANMQMLTMLAFPVRAW